MNYTKKLKNLTKSSISFLLVTVGFILFWSHSALAFMPLFHDIATERGLHNSKYKELNPVERELENGVKLHFQPKAIDNISSAN